MTRLRFFAIFFILILNQGCIESDTESTPFKSEEIVNAPNILFIAIDDLRNDLGVLGANHMKTPNLDSFARESRVFTHHFVQVPTCGSSRAALLRGQRATFEEFIPNSAIRNTYEMWGHRSMPSWFRQHGYQTLSLGKITHHPGGLTGENWAEGPEELPDAWDRSWIPDSPWLTPQEMMHGYANGTPREQGKSPALETYDGPDKSYPDGWVAEEAIKVLKNLSDSKKPWFFAVGFFKPHLPFAAPKKYFDLYDPEELPIPDNTMKPAYSPSSWHDSGELMGNYGQHPDHPNDDKAYAQQLRHGYAAATSYVDVQIGKVLEAFENLELSKNTIVVIWGDHGFALGEHGIWGKHSLYEAALKSPLIIRYPGINAKGVHSHEIVETIDIFPTLTDLTGIPSPSELEGQSLRKQLENPEAKSEKPAYAHWKSGQKTIRVDDWRLIVHESNEKIEGFELFDFRKDKAGKLVRPFDYPDITDKLTEKLYEL